MIYPHVGTAAHALQHAEYYMNYKTMLLNGADFTQLLFKLTSIFSNPVSVFVYSL